MARMNVVSFPGTKQASSWNYPLPEAPWYVQMARFFFGFGLLLVRRLLTFAVLVCFTVGNSLFTVSCGLLHLIVRFMVGFALVMGLGYATIVWFLASAAKTPADPNIWEYLGRFEIGMLSVFTVGVALDLALTMGKDWIYAQLEKAKPLMEWGLG